MRHPRVTRRTGAAAVEFAVVSLIFFTLVLGVFELGRGFMVNYSLINAARRGCRAAVPVGKSNSDITTATNAAMDAAKLQGSTITVQVNGVVADASTAATNDKITVIVSIPASNISWVPARFLSGTLSGQYTARRE